MKLRLRLSIRMLLFIISAAALVFFSTVSIISRNFKRVAYTEAMETNQGQAKKYASIIQAAIESDFNKIRGYKQIVEGSTEFSYNKQRALFAKTLIDMVDENKNFAALWDTWEIPYGSITRNVYFDEFNSISIAYDSVSIENADTYSFYYTFKQLPIETISSPKASKKNKKILEASIIVPLNVNNQFAGLVGADIRLERFQKFIDSINTQESFDVSLIAFGGDIIAHQNKKLIGENIGEVDTFLISRFNIIDQIQLNNASNYILKDKHANDSVYYNIMPFAIGNTKTPWGILITTPLTEIESRLSATTKGLSDAIFWGLVLLGIVVLIFAISITLPIWKTRNILNKLALGDVHSITKLPVVSDDEMGEMAQSLNTVVDGLNKVTEFAENIGAGNYDYNFEKLSSEKQNFVR